MGFSDLPERKNSGDGFKNPEEEQNTGRNEAISLVEELEKVENDFEGFVPSESRGSGFKSRYHDVIYE